MHLLSSIMGFALPALLPRAYTHFASAVSCLWLLMVVCNFDMAISQVLFLYFGLRLLKDGYEMTGEGPSDELQEVEEELVTKKGDGNEMDDEEVDIEAAGSMKGKKRASGEQSGAASATKGFMQSLETETFKVFTQVSLVFARFNCTSHTMSPGFHTDLSGGVGRSVPDCHHRAGIVQKCIWCFSGWFRGPCVLHWPCCDWRAHAGGTNIGENRGHSGGSVVHILRGDVFPLGTGCLRAASEWRCLLGLGAMLVCHSGQRHCTIVQVFFIKTFAFSHTFAWHTVPWCNLDVWHGTVCPPVLCTVYAIDVEQPTTTAHW